MKFAVLASGSSGNCTWAEADGTSLLVDAGLNAKTVSALAAGIGRDVKDVQGVLVTHDHADHVSSLAVLENRTGVPIYATDGTACAIERAAAKGSGKKPDWNFRIFEAGASFEIGAFLVEAFPVPHDAADPVGFVLRTADGASLGLATDLGEAPLVVRHHLRGCGALVVEFNHERRLLLDSARPPSLKQRILDRSGHLSNAQAAELLEAVATPALRHVVPAHLSAECNTPDNALAAAREALRAAGVDPRAVLRDPACPTPLFEL